MKIRNLKKEELEIILPWINETVKITLGEFWNPETIKENVIKSFKKEPEGFIGIEENSELIAFIRIKTLKNNTCHISDLYVKKEFRGKGLGKKLMEIADEYAKRKGAKRITLNVRKDNEPALNLYKKSGFKIKKYQMWKIL